MVNVQTIIHEQLSEAAELHALLKQSQILTKQLGEWSQKCASALAKGGIIFFAGNGGSFADAQHMAAELTGKMGRMRKSLSGIALGANNSSISAIGNDFGYEYSFSREFEGLHRPNSVVIAFSTSGNSKNLTELAKASTRLETPMVGLTGKNVSELSELCEVIRLPSNRTERVQEMQTLFGHTLCLCVEEILGLSDEPYGS